MDLEAEIERLKRQNHRLRVALFSIVALLLVAVVTVAGTARIAETRAKADAQRALAREEQARDHAAAAFARAQEALESTTVPDDGNR